MFFLEQYFTEKYSDCADGSEVELITVPGAGHLPFLGNTLPSPPDPSKPTIEVDTTELVWNFLKTHSRKPLSGFGVITGGGQVGFLFLFVSLLSSLTVFTSLLSYRSIFSYPLLFCFLVLLVFYYRLLFASFFLSPHLLPSPLLFSSTRLLVGQATIRHLRLLHSSHLVSCCYVPSGWLLLPWG